MTMTSQIASESPAARRFRLIVPLVVLLGMALLIMAPGFISELGHDRDAGPPQVINQLAPAAPEG